MFSLFLFFLLFLYPEGSRGESVSLFFQLLKATHIQWLVGIFAYLQSTKLHLSDCSSICLPLVLAGQDVLILFNHKLIYSRMNNLYILTLGFWSQFKMLICHLRDRIHSSLWIMMCNLLRSWRQGQACSFRYSLNLLPLRPFLTILVHPPLPQCTLHCFPASFFSITNSFLFSSLAYNLYAVNVNWHYSTEAPISRSMCVVEASSGNTRNQSCFCEFSKQRLKYVLTTDHHGFSVQLGDLLYSGEP